ncbi:hypothetical protein [Halanaerobium congolense]|uniref:hypothetical protein n=1 Tax=Halanaerobium congolense TaxID=54121 RepID=UPI0010670F4F|nr:hypothetical protein [Halanaerobium congolense]
MKSFSLDKKNYSNKINESSPQAPSIDNNQLESLGICYQLENSGEIFDYLTDKSDLLTFLLKAAEKSMKLLLTIWNLLWLKNLILRLRTLIIWLFI